LAQGDLEEVGTDVNGDYELTGLNPGTSYAVVALPAEYDGYLPTLSNGAAVDTGSPTVTLTPAGTTANIALVKGGTVTGTVTDPSGAGVQNISVKLQDLSGQQVRVYFSDGTGDINEAFLQTQTDSAGSYTIAGAEPGSYPVYFEGSGSYASVYYPGSVESSDATPLTVGLGSDLTANQTLSVSGVISGTVEDGVNGGGYTGGGQVNLYPAGTSANSQDRIDAVNIASDGTYSVTGLLPGTYDIEFKPYNQGSPDDYATAWYGGSSLAPSQGSSTAITVVAGSSSTADATLVQGGAISGTVSLNGEPARNVGVELLDGQDNLVGDGEFSASTLQDGTYTTVDLLPGTYEVKFTSDGGSNVEFQYYSGASTLAAATTVTVTAAATTPNINAVLTTGAAISGTVTDAATGADLDNIEVYAEDSQGNILASAGTNPDGTYSLAGLATGSYYLEFEDVSSLSGGSSDLQTQYYGDRQVLAGSTPVSVTAGQVTSGINAALATGGAPSQATTTPGPVTTTPGPTTTVPVDVAPMLAGTVPTIIGTVRVGKTLNANVTGWTAGTTFSYQWYAAGKAITGATGATLTLTGADVKEAISVVVTGEQSGYVWLTETSLETEAAAAGTLKTVVPKITGTAKVGKTLAAKTGAWTTGVKFTYQWYANKKAIRSATKATFKLAGAEKAKTVTVRVTGKLTGYSTAAKTSRATKKVAAA
jgi:Carboxypeptidase regulatory-like domain